MKKILLGGLAVALMVVSAPVAHASASYDITGGCSFDTNSQETVTNGDYVGTISDSSVTTDKATPPAPVSATVSCKITVNGVDAPGTEFSYSDIVTGVQGGANQISFTAADEDIVKLCEKVVYAGPPTETDDWNCATSTSLQVPPEVVIDTINDFWIGTLDPATCGTFAANAGNYGGVIIESDGDLIVPDPLDLGLNPVNDCPPYGS